MKKYATFTIKRSAETTVVVRFDDQDGHSESDLREFAIAKLMSDMENVYEWGRQEFDEVRHLVSADPPDYFIEVMPRPDDWVLRRASSAFKDELNVCAFGIPGSRSELKIDGPSTYIIQRLVIVNGARLLAPRTLDIEILFEPTPSTDEMTDLANRVNEFLGSSLSVGEVCEKLKIAFELPWQ